MNKPLPSVGRYQGLDATHIEILALRPGYAQMRCFVDLVILPWGLTLYNVGISCLSGKWSTVIPKREERVEGRFPRRVPVLQFTSHAQRFFDNAVLVAANAYRGDQTAQRPNVLQFFDDLNEESDEDPSE